MTEVRERDLIRRVERLERERRWTWRAGVLMVGVFALVVILIATNVLRYAYTRLGVSSGTALGLLLASLLGSYVNIPVWEDRKSVV